MKEQSIDATVYAAGLVFAPTEDETALGTIPARAPAKPDTSSLARSKPQPVPETYQIRYRAVAPPERAAADSSWARTLDLSWLLGRATA